MVDSYPNFIRTIEHMVSAYPQEFDRLSWYVYRSKGDMQN
jgi:hypothetical protein